MTSQLHIFNTEQLLSVLGLDVGTWRFFIEKARLGLLK